MTIASLRTMSHLEEKNRSGQKVMDKRRLRNDNQIYSSPEQQENVHSVWQLDLSNCASLGLGSAIRAYFSCICNTVHHSP